MEAKEVLFSSVVPVNIKRTTLAVVHEEKVAFDERGHLREPKVEPATHENRHSAITVQVVLASSTSSRFKVLQLQLTDETDPYFFYALSINEDEFHTLKSDQSLLVDFLQFPAKFIELLQACMTQSNKFVCSLTSDGAPFGTFSIVETNTFKHINHLSLCFVPGTDATIKKYLASLVKDFKVETSTLKTTLANTKASLSSQLQDSQATISRLSSELESYKILNSQQEAKLKLEHANEVSALRDSFVNERDASRSKFDFEIQSTLKRHEEESRALTEKLSSLTLTHSNTVQHLQSLESALLTSNKSNESLSREVSHLSKDVERLNVLRQQTEREKAELQGHLTVFREKSAELERKSREHGDSGRQLEDRVQFLQEQKDKLTETIELYKSQQNHQDDGIRKASDEINKGNEIIRRLQAELKSAKSKLKLKNVVTLQQEKLLDERKSSTDGMQKEISTLKEVIAKKSEESSDLNKKVEEIQTKLDESKGIIEDNNHVIEWLHKQLNEEALNRGFPSTGGVAGYRPIDFEKYAGTEKRPTSTANYRKAPEARRFAGLVGSRSPEQQFGRVSPDKIKSPIVPLTARINSPSVQNAAMSNSNVATSTTHLNGGTNTLNSKPQFSHNVGLKSSYF